MWGLRIFKDVSALEQAACKVLALKDEVRQH